MKFSAFPQNPRNVAAFALPWRDGSPWRRGPFLRLMGAEAVLEEQAGSPTPRQPETGLWRGCLCQGLRLRLPQDLCLHLWNSVRLCFLLKMCS